MMINKDLLKMGYFLVYKNTGGVFGNAIVARQKAAGFSPENAQYTHVECSGGEIHSINISPPISKLVDITQVHKGQYVKVVRFKNYEYEEGKRYKVAYFSAALCANKPYDVAGILAFLSFLSKWVKQNNRLYFCSEGCAAALQMVFPNAFGLPPDKVMPAHFLDTDLFETVIEGVL